MARTKKATVEFDFDVPFDLDKFYELYSATQWDSDRINLFLDMVFPTLKMMISNIGELLGRTESLKKVYSDRESKKWFAQNVFHYLNVPSNFKRIATLHKLDHVILCAKQFVEEISDKNLNDEGVNKAYRFIQYELNLEESRVYLDHKHYKKGYLQEVFWSEELDCHRIIDMFIISFLKYLVSIERSDIRFCLRCKRLFSRQGKPRSSFCSRKCTQAHHNKKRKLSDEDKADRKYKAVFSNTKRKPKKRSR